MNASLKLQLCAKQPKVLIRSELDVFQRKKASRRETKDDDTHQTLCDVVKRATVDVAAHLFYHSTEPSILVTNSLLPPKRHKLSGVAHGVNVRSAYIFFGK